MNQNEIKNFGARICALRKARGMTQAQLAEMIHVSNKAVSRWETGEGYPEITLLRPLAKALGVSVDELLRDDDDSEKRDDPDDPFQKQDGKQTYHSGNVGKKEYKHKDIPVAWPNFSFSMKKLKIKSLGLLDLAAYIYFIIFVCVMSSANYAMIYQKDMTDHWGQFCTAQMGYIFLGIAAVVGIVLIGLHAYFMARDSRRFCYLRNMIFLGGALFSAFLFLNPVRGVKGENLDVLANCRPAAWLGCDFFQVNRKLILIMTVVLVLLYLGSTLIHAIIVGKKSGSESKPDHKRGKFWRSLIVFNRISWVCVVVSSVCAAIYLIICMLITFSQYSFDSPYYFITGSGAVISVMITAISSFVSKVGIIAGLIGIGTGLFDVCDRQIKASVIFVIANVVLMYVPTLLILASQGMAFMSFFDAPLW